MALELMLAVLAARRMLLRNRHKRCPFSYIHILVLRENLSVSARPHLLRKVHQKASGVVVMRTVNQSDSPPSAIFSTLQEVQTFHSLDSAKHLGHGSE